MQFIASVGWIEVAQDETRKDADDKSITFGIVDGASFVLDVHGQIKHEERVAAGIASTYNNIMAPYFDKCAKQSAYASDNCNLLLKVRSIVVAERKTFGIGCFLQVQANASACMLKIEMFGIPKSN